MAPLELTDELKKNIAQALDDQSLLKRHPLSERPTRLQDLGVTACYPEDFKRDVFRKQFRILLESPYMLTPYISEVYGHEIIPVDKGRRPHDFIYILPLSHYPAEEQMLTKLKTLEVSSSNCVFYDPRSDPEKGCTALTAAQCSGLQSSKYQSRVLAYPAQCSLFSSLALEAKWKCTVNVIRLSIPGSSEDLGIIGELFTMLRRLFSESQSVVRREYNDKYKRIEYVLWRYLQFCKGEEGQQKFIKRVLDDDQHVDSVQRLRLFHDN